MPRFVANLTMMYTEVLFLERFAATARDGFQAVDYLFPYTILPRLCSGMAKSKANYG